MFFSINIINEKGCELMYLNLVNEIIRNTILTVMLISGIIIIIPFIVSLLISVFQAVTQIQEQTLVFLPKYLIVLTIVLFGGPIIVNKLATLFITVMNAISTV